MKFGISNNEDIKLSGSEQASKDICKAKSIGTWKAINMESLQTQ